MLPAYTPSTESVFFEVGDLHQALLDSTNASKALIAAETFYSGSVDATSSVVLAKFVTKTPAVLGLLTHVFKKNAAAATPVFLALSNLATGTSPEFAPWLFKTGGFASLITAAPLAPIVSGALSRMLQFSPAAAKNFAVNGFEGILFQHVTTFPAAPPPLVTQTVAIMEKAVSSERVKPPDAQLSSPSPPSPSLLAEVSLVMNCVGIITAMWPHAAKDPASRKQLVGAVLRRMADLPPTLLIQMARDAMPTFFSSFGELLKCVVPTLASPTTTTPSSGAAEQPLPTTTPPTTTSEKELLGNASARIISYLVREAPKDVQARAAATVLCAALSAFPATVPFLFSAEQLDSILVSCLSAPRFDAKLNYTVLCLALKGLQGKLFCEAAVQLACNTIVVQDATPDEWTVCLRVLIGTVSRPPTVQIIEHTLTRDTVTPMLNAALTIESAAALRQAAIVFIHILTHSYSLALAAHFQPMQRYFATNFITPAEFQRMTNWPTSAERDDAVLQRIDDVRTVAGGLWAEVVDVRAATEGGATNEATALHQQFEARMNVLKSEPTYIVWLDTRLKSLQAMKERANFLLGNMRARQQRIQTRATEAVNEIMTDLRSQRDGLKEAHAKQLRGVVWDPDELANMESALQGKLNRIAKQGEKQMNETKTFNAWRVAMMGSIMEQVSKRELERNRDVTVIVAQEERARGAGYFFLSSFVSSDAKSIVAMEAEHRREVQDLFLTSMSQGSMGSEFELAKRQNSLRRRLTQHELSESEERFIVEFTAYISFLQNVAAQVVSQARLSIALCSQPVKDEHGTVVIRPTANAASVSEQLIRSVSSLTDVIERPIQQTLLHRTMSSSLRRGVNSPQNRRLAGPAAELLSGSFGSSAVTEDAAERSSGGGSSASPGSSTSNHNLLSVVTNPSTSASSQRQEATAVKPFGGGGGDDPDEGASPMSSIASSTAAVAGVSLGASCDSNNMSSTFSPTLSLLEDERVARLGVLASEGQWRRYNVVTFALKNVMMQSTIEEHRARASIHLEREHHVQLLSLWDDTEREYNHIRVTMMHLKLNQSTATTSSEGYVRVGRRDSDFFLHTPTDDGKSSNESGRSGPISTAGWPLPAQRAVEYHSARCDALLGHRALWLSASHSAMLKEGTLTLLWVKAQQASGRLALIESRMRRTMQQQERAEWATSKPYFEMCEKERSFRGFLDCEENIELYQICVFRPRGRRYRPPKDEEDVETYTLDAATSNRIRAWQRSIAWPVEDDPVALHEAALLEALSRQHDDDDDDGGALPSQPAPNDDPDEDPSHTDVSPRAAATLVPRKLRSAVSAQAASQKLQCLEQVESLHRRGAAREECLLRQRVTLDYQLLLVSHARA